jgi:hypothetical protein
MALEGALLVEGRSRKGWLPRYFILNGSSLQERQGSGGKVKSEVALNSEEVTVVVEESKDDGETHHDWVFTLHVANKPRRLAAPTEKQMNRWVAAIQDVVSEAETRAREHRSASTAGISDPGGKFGVEWVADASVTRCRCGTQFAGSLSKHHCCFCGKVYCSFCSKSKKLHPLTFKEERACTACSDSSGQARRRGGALRIFTCCFRCNRKKLMSEPVGEVEGDDGGLIQVGGAKAAL